MVFFAHTVSVFPENNALAWGSYSTLKLCPTHCFAGSLETMWSTSTSNGGEPPAETSRASTPNKIRPGTPVKLPSMQFRVRNEDALASAGGPLGGSRPGTPQSKPLPAVQQPLVAVSSINQFQTLPPIAPKGTSDDKTPPLPGENGETPNPVSTNNDGTGNHAKKELTGTKTEIAAGDGRHSPENFTSLRTQGSTPNGVSSSSDSPSQGNGEVDVAERDETVAGSTGDSSVKESFISDAEHNSDSVEKEYPEKTRNSAERKDPEKFLVQPNDTGGTEVPDASNRDSALHSEHSSISTPDDQQSRGACQDEKTADQRLPCSDQNSSKTEPAAAKEPASDSAAPSDQPRPKTYDLDPVMRKVYLGMCSYPDLPPLTKKVVRIFVSSTFSGNEVTFRCQRLGLFRKTINSVPATAQGFMLCKSFVFRHQGRKKRPDATCLPEVGRFLQRETWS